MPRPDAVRAVAEIRERLGQASAVFLAEYAGLSVKEQQDLRRGLREGGAEFKVVKMTLARRAAAELDIDTLDDLLLGPTGLAFADDDAVAAAKTLRDFARDHEVFTIKGGLLGSEFLTPERIAQLADIEPREVLFARMAGAAKAPLSNFAGLVAALPRGLATAVQQLIDRSNEDGVAAEAGEKDAPQKEAAGTAVLESKASDEAAGPADESVPEGGASEKETGPVGEEKDAEKFTEPEASGEDKAAGDDDADSKASAEEIEETNDDDDAAAAAEEE